MRSSAFFACVRVCSETFASLPAILYKRLPDGGKERATDHPLYKLLHDKPNAWQTSFEFFEMMQGHLELRGNAYAIIEPGGIDGGIGALVPIHPDRVNVFRLPNGRLIYKITVWYSGEIETYTQDEILHIRGLSSDGILGMSTVAVAREPIGISLALQDYAARFLANDSTPRGILETANKMSPEARKNSRESWQKAQTGENRHKTALLEEGLTYKAMSLSNVDSQFIEARKFSIGDIARLFRVPPHKIGDLEKAAFSNIEQQSIEFVTDCIRPRVVRWERRISVDLIDPLGLEGEYFLEFNMDALLRGDIESRYKAYSIGRLGGWLKPNDVCRLENLNPIPEEKGGEDYLVPANTMVVGAPQLPAPADPPDTGLVQEDSSAVNGKRLHDFVKAAAGRLVRREVTALRKSHVKAAGDSEQFRKEAEAFYSSFGDLVADTMRLDRDGAEAYVVENRKRITGNGNPLVALDYIETVCPDLLALRALGVSL